jgi:hypothetical protein
MPEIKFLSSFVPAEYVCFIAEVGIATTLGVRRSEVRILVPTRDFSQLQNVETDSGALPVSYSVGSEVL